MKWQKTFLTWFVLKMANNADSATHQEYYYIISIRYSINERKQILTFNNYTWLKCDITSKYPDP